MDVNLKPLLLCKHNRDDTLSTLQAGFAALKKRLNLFYALHLFLLPLQSFQLYTLFKNHVRTDLPCFQSIMQNIYLQNIL